MKTITTLSQLGARLSLARLHVTLLTNAAEGKAINHAFYVVDSKNKKMMEYGEELASKHQVRNREDNNFTRFGRTGVPPYGGDFNYDFLLRSCEIGDAFLTLHDDSLIYSGNVFELVRESLAGVNFGGYLDQRAIETYQKILLDGVPLSELRIGTWFLFGNTKVYRDGGYALALYKNYYRWLINIKFRTTRISAKAFRLWLNGGFDLNIRARLDGQEFSILDKTHGARLGSELEHFEKFTGFFTRRNMLGLVDTNTEVDAWMKRHADKARLKDSDAAFEVEFLESMAKMLDSFGIQDPLLNLNVVEDLRRLR